MPRTLHDVERELTDAHARLEQWFDERIAKDTEELRRLKHESEQSSKRILDLLDATKAAVAGAQEDLAGNWYNNIACWSIEWAFPFLK